MTWDEWKPLARLLADCWAGEFTGTMPSSYFTLLEPYDGNAVRAALMALSTSQKWLPKVPEIVQQMRAAVEPPVPAWTEVWQALQRAMKKRTEVAAMEFLRDDVHPVVASFMVAEGGWAVMKMAPLFHDDYGMLRQKELRERWEEFVAVAKERVQRGISLAAVERRGIGLPSRLDTASLLGFHRRGELPSGEDGTIRE